MKYNLVNPYIEGDIKTEFEGSSSLKAADECWSKLSTYFTNYVPQFAFSLKSSKGSLHHFMVNENTENGKVSYSISALENKVSKKNEDIIKDSANKLQQGGKRHKKHDDDDSSSSSDSDLISKKLEYEHMRRYGQQPIMLWNYYPTVYELDYCFFPTFTVPLTPYILFRFP
jgi:hypothetical protein